MIINTYSNLTQEEKLSIYKKIMFYVYVKENAYEKRGNICEAVGRQKGKFIDRGTD